MNSPTLTESGIPSVPLVDTPDEIQVEETLRLTGPELAVCIATEVMDWRLMQDGNTGSWMTAQDEPAGYYYGHPFRPYRDRNILMDVLKRIDELALRDRYMEQLMDLLSSPATEAGRCDLWSLHTVDPHVASCAALLAVRAATK